MPTHTWQPSDADTYLKKNSAGTNFGTATECLLGTDVDTPNDTFHSLLRFELASGGPAPPFLIQEVKLHLEHHSVAPPGQLRISRCSKSNLWVESEATWNDYRSGLAWANTGGDRDGTESVVFNIPSSGLEIYDITDLGRYCIETDGIIDLLLERESGIAPAYAHFRSSEWTTASERPKIEVTWTRASYRRFHDRMRRAGSQ